MSIVEIHNLIDIIHINPTRFHIDTIIYTVLCVFSFHFLSLSLVWHHALLRWCMVAVCLQYIWYISYNAIFANGLISKRVDRRRL